MTSVKTIVALFLVSSLLETEARRRTKKETKHEIKPDDAPTLEDLQNEDKVNEHQKNVEKDKKENVFSKETREEETEQPA